MKKDIKNYAGKQYDICVNNAEEYNAIVDVLNTVFKFWRKDKFAHYATGADKIYIHLSSDSTSNKPYHDHEILSASDFIYTKEEINNTYNLW